MTGVEDDIFEQIRTYLPPYLSPTDKEELFSELKKFPNNFNYYLPRHDDTYLQGDGWRGFVAINFYTRASKTISGVIMSNTCDIAPENPSARERSIIFSPLIRLSAYARQLELAGKTQTGIGSLLDTIRRQHVTTIFYLPSIHGVIEESIVLLDNIHSHPLSHFHGEKQKQRLFVLNQFGFYLFLMKLSIHFTRFQEGVNRVSH